MLNQDTFKSYKALVIYLSILLMLLLISAMANLIFYELWMTSSKTTSDLDSQVSDLPLKQETSNVEIDSNEFEKTKEELQQTKLELKNSRNNTSKALLKISKKEESLARLIDIAYFYEKNFSDYRKSAEGYIDTFELSKAERKVKLEKCIDEFYSLPSLKKAGHEKALNDYVDVLYYYIFSDRKDFAKLNRPFSELDKYGCLPPCHHLKFEELVRASNDYSDYVVNPAMSQAKSEYDRMWEQWTKIKPIANRHSKTIEVLREDL